MGTPSRHSQSLWLRALLPSAVKKIKATGLEQHTHNPPKIFGGFFLFWSKKSAPAN